MIKSAPTPDFRFTFTGSFKQLLYFLFKQAAQGRNYIFDVMKKDSYSFHSPDDFRTSFFILPCFPTEEFEEASAGGRELPPAAGGTGSVLPAA